LAQLKENIDAESLGLSDEVIAGIDAIHARYTNPGQ
jgi:aryl-alcohol dehydrogenase-like predicted oxidoreductase